MSNGKKEVADQTLKECRGGIIPGYMLREIGSRSPDPEVKAAAATTIASTQRLMEEAQAARTAAHGLSPRITGRELRREIWDAHESNGQGFEVRSEGSRPYGDFDIDEAYELAGLVHEYYKAVHGRISIDDQGMTLVSRVHFRADPPNAFNSAFFDGDQMTYGSGDGNFFNTFVHPFVAGHEFTHGVTRSEVDFFPWGESATLNEHVSDAFAAIIEMRRAAIPVEKYHWIAVRGIHRAGINSLGLRHMLNPGTAFDDPKIGKDRQPAHMRDYVQTGEDNGGAHINNGICNRAFALACMKIGGFSWDQMQHIWYHARNHAEKRATFASFAGNTINACDALDSKKHIDTLLMAWREVGIEPTFAK